MILTNILVFAGVGFSLLPAVAAKVQYMGMNIAGFEFGCEIDGTCPTGSVTPPLSALGGADGAGQMQHFVKDDRMNIFRLPVSWQFLVNNKLGGVLDSTNFAKYDRLMQACLDTGASCAIDIHNFARFNGKIIGQSSGGPTDEQFANFWSELAGRYKGNDKVIFGLMNEPHDVDITAWAATVQKTVTAIRQVGAVTQMILLPGNNFASAEQFVSSGSGAALMTVKNPDGSTDGLVFDIHKYLDVDNSGTHNECTTDNIADAFAIVATFLRENGRQAIVSETGAGKTDACFKAFCAQNTFINANSDVYLGYIAWAAGSFSTSYVLSLTPSNQNGKFVDNELASKCVISPWLEAASVVVPTVSSSASLREVTSTTSAAAEVVISASITPAALKPTTTSQSHLLAPVATSSTAAMISNDAEATSINIADAQTSSDVPAPTMTSVSTPASMQLPATTAVSSGAPAIATSGASGRQTSGPIATPTPMTFTGSAKKLKFGNGILAGGGIILYMIL